MRSRTPDTRTRTSDAEVAEIAYTAFAGTPEAITARLVVRRVKDANHLDALFPEARTQPASRLYRVILLS